MKEKGESNQIFNTEFSFDFGNETNEYFQYKASKKELLNEIKQTKNMDDDANNDMSDDQDDELVDEDAAPQTPRANKKKNTENKVEEEEAEDADDDVTENAEAEKSKQELEAIKKKHGTFKSST